MAPKTRVESVQHGTLELGTEILCPSWSSLLSSPLSPCAGPCSQLFPQDTFPWGLGHMVMDNMVWNSQLQGALSNAQWKACFCIPGSLSFEPLQR